jgi:hypothetical protein
MPQGSDFGSDFGDDYGDDYGDDMGYAGNFGDDMGYSGSFGDDFGAAAAAMAKVPSHPRLAAKRVAVMTSKRENLLNPNKHSLVKTESYKFNVAITNPATSASPLFGTASALAGTNTPDTWFRPERATLNVQDAGLVMVSDIKVGNVSAQVGGQSDGFDLSPLGVGSGRLSLPLMNQSTKASFTGTWSAFIPPARVPGSLYTLTLGFVGWATMAP